MPKEKAHLFSGVRTGRMHKAGWGTQTSKKQYSINNYFIKNNIPLELTIYNIEKVEKAPKFVTQNLLNDNDMIICYNSQLLFGDRDVEHVSLLQEIDTENDELTIINPSIGVPKTRKTKLSRLIQVLESHKIIRLGGLWLVSRTR